MVHLVVGAFRFMLPILTETAWNCAARPRDEKCCSTGYSISAQAGGGGAVAKDNRSASLAITDQNLTESSAPNVRGSPGYAVFDTVGRTERIA